MTDKLRDAAQQVEREAFEAYMDTHEPSYWRTTARARDAWVIWHSSWLANAALAQQDAQAVPLPEHETEAMHDAVMAVMYKGVTRTNTNALWQAYRCAILNSAPTPPTNQDAHAVTMESAGWQAIECPNCGEMSRAWSKSPVQQDAQAVLQGDKGTPGAWFVRKLVRDGELKDCFVAAPSFDGMPYDAEILGDDEYRDGVERKLADCELIVAAVNALRAAPTPPAQCVLLTDEEIERLRVDQEFTEWRISEDLFLLVARAVIEAYEIKNGLKP